MSFAPEPERYELFEAPRYQFDLTRREAIAMGLGGLVLVVSVPAADAAPSTVARLHFGEDGIVTVHTGKVEFGQGARTEVAMAAAEELRLPLERVRVLMADTSLTPDDGITAGSRSTPATIPAVRRAAAHARRLKEQAGVADYQELARQSNLDAKLREIVDAPLTAPDNWTVLGKPSYRTDAQAIVTGAHQYPSDIQLPGMLYGAVLRPPSYGAKLTAVDLEPAQQQEGVAAVRDAEFVGCAASTSFQARQALQALAKTAQWETRESPSSTVLFDHLRKTANLGKGRGRESGDVQAGLESAAKSLKSSYQVSYIQHAPMEPRAAVAHWTDGRLTVYTGTQNPFGVRSQLCQAFHLTPEQVRVIVPDSGGGFGGKHTGEVAIEAARLAKHCGKPVSLRWTRQEEFAWAYFRPAGLFDCKASIDDRGRMVAWDFTSFNAGAAALESPYDAPNARTRFVPCESPLREGSYRGIAATANNFARECFIDELAALAKQDPLAFRLANLSNARLRDVLVAAAEKFRWNARRNSKLPNRGIGLSCGTEKGSYVAACVEVEVTQAKPRIVGFVMAFECGAILNPANLRAQVEGSLIQGLGGALTEEIAFESGRLLNGRFAQYKVPRFRDVPPFEVVLLDRKDLAPAGAGETPIIAVAPAIANAVAHATGRPARTMPVKAAV